MKWSETGGLDEIRASGKVVQWVQNLRAGLYPPAFDVESLCRETEELQFDDVDTASLTWQSAQTGYESSRGSLV